MCILVSVFLRNPPQLFAQKTNVFHEGVCVMMVTSQVLNDSTAAGRPALGASFTFMSDVTLWLARPPGQDRELRTAEVLRSRVSVRSAHPPFPGLTARVGYKMTKARCTLRIRQGRVLASQLA
jgi:hypothetical protein